MNREELIKLLQSWLTTATDDNGNPIHVIMDVDIHEIATEIIKSSLPPAEGAEAIVKKYEDEYDFKFHWVQRDRVIRMMREFAAQPQPKFDPKKVQWSGYGELGNISQKPLQPTAEGAEDDDDEIILGEPDKLNLQWSGYGPLGNISQKPLQPTAEGAEEITARLNELLGNPDKSIHVNSYQIKPIIVDGKAEWWIVHHGIGLGEPLAQWHNKFAALHAQRIAEKMVSERMEQYKAQFKDRPNPLEVNPYDSKGIKRIRNRKIH